MALIGLASANAWFAYLSAALWNETVFGSLLIKEGFEAGNVVYFQLSRSTPASRKVSVSSGSRFSLKATWFATWSTYKRRVEQWYNGLGVVCWRGIYLSHTSLLRCRFPRLPHSHPISWLYMAMLAVQNHCLKAYCMMRWALVLVVAWMSHGEFTWTFFNTTIVAIIVYLTKPIWLFALSTASDVVYLRCNMVTWILPLAHVQQRGGNMFVFSVIFDAGLSRLYLGHNRFCFGGAQFNWSTLCIDIGIYYWPFKHLWSSQFVLLFLLTLRAVDLKRCGLGGGSPWTLFLDSSWLMCSRGECHLLQMVVRICISRRGSMAYRESIS